MPVSQACLCKPFVRVCSCKCACVNFIVQACSCEFARVVCLSRVPVQVCLCEFAGASVLARVRGLFPEESWQRLRKERRPQEVAEVGVRLEELPAVVPVDTGAELPGAGEGNSLVGAGCRAAGIWTGPAYAARVLARQSTFQHCGGSVQFCALLSNHVFWSKRSFACISLWGHQISHALLGKQEVLSVVR